MAKDLAKKRAAFRKGLWAELYAAWYLRFKGFSILARRYKTPMGEVDIIAKRGHLLIFVEVKARPTLQDAMEAVSRRAEKRITAAALHWHSYQKAYHNFTLRFDLIAICPRRLPQHVPSFFSA